MTLNGVQKSKKEPASIMNAKATSKRTLLRSDFFVKKQNGRSHRVAPAASGQAALRGRT